MDLKLGTDGDLVFESGNLVLISGVEATAQRLRGKMSTFLGDWYLDKRVGFPFFRDVLIKRPDVRLVLAMVREVILSDPGVTEIVTLNFDFDTPERTFTVDAVIRGLDAEPFPVSFQTFILKSERQQ